MELTKIFRVLLHLSLFGAGLMFCWHTFKDFVSSRTAYSVSTMVLSSNDLPSLGMCLEKGSDSKQRVLGDHFTVDAKISSNKNKTIRLSEKMDVEAQGLQMKLTEVP